ncbi:MAG: DUF5908 family protein [Bacteroidia bacterium]|nr:DUF5908 family protein [Bacteroidia bacterium]
MPIEIRELVIRATITDEPRGSGQSKTGRDGASQAEKAEKIVAQVSEILRKKKER